MVRYGDGIDIKGIISTVTERLSAGNGCYHSCFAMRLNLLPSKEVLLFSHLGCCVCLVLTFRSFGFIKILQCSKFLKNTFKDMQRMSGGLT